jgi:hypothetical protein
MAHNRFKFSFNTAFFYRKIEISQREALDVLEASLSPKPPFVMAALISSALLCRVAAAPRGLGKPVDGEVIRNSAIE